MKTTCILIATSHYASDKIPKIPMCQNDLRQVSETFANHLSIPSTSIHAVGMDNPEAAKRSNILRVVTNAPAL